MSPISKPKNSGSSSQDLSKDLIDLDQDQSLKKLRDKNWFTEEEYKQSNLLEEERKDEYNIVYSGEGEDVFP